MNVLTIAVRELRSMFATPVGWLVLCAWLLLTGLFWVLHVTTYVMQGQEMAFDPYGGSQLNLSDGLFVPFFGNCAIILIIVAPALSMRVFAEEVKQRTLELLMTSPVSTFEIVAGKYLGLLSMVGVLLLATVQFPLMLLSWGSPDPGVLLGCYLGLLLFGSGMVSLGMLLSSLTSNQVVALVLTVLAGLGLWIVSWGSSDPNDWFAQVSLTTHLSELMRGAVKVSDVAYYLGFTWFFVFATLQRMESFRWK